MDQHATRTSGLTEIQNAWIPLSDGNRLAARIWMPSGAAHRPVPAVLEYIPYRKRDDTVSRDEPLHRAMAERGYAGVRVDIRGSGDSDGLMEDEYTEQEQRDAVEVIDWIASRDWCDGAVGMIGLSWGGFSGLQVAALRPGPLKAIVTVCSSDDRYASDVHYKGGCLLNDNLSWGAVMLSYCSRPPDPAVVGERWRRMWHARLENLPFFSANWLEHQHRDAYWRQGSVCETPDAIRAAILAVGGWRDPYAATVPRILTGQRAPRRGIVGPWGHRYPSFGEPGPTLDFVDEVGRWWDRWLRGNAPEGDEPALLAFLQDSPDHAGPAACVEGRWVAADDWPDPARAERRWHTSADGRLTRDGGKEPASHRLRSPQTVGMLGGRFCPYRARGGDMPGDQRPDDAGSLVFDTAALTEPLEVLGTPRVVLRFRVDEPVANVAVRLCDVGPDGTSTRVTYGCLNLAHRDGHAQPAALEPNRSYSVTVELDPVAWGFRPGHRLRLALSTAYWPLIWPAPEPVTMEVDSPATMLLLPERDPRDGQTPPAARPAAGAEPEAAIEPLDEAAVTRSARRDLTTGEGVVERVDDDGGTFFRDHGLSTRNRSHEIYRVHPDNPLSARAEVDKSCRLWRSGWSVRIDTHCTMTADRECFHLEAEVVGFENEQEVKRARMQRRIPRRLV